MSNADVVLSYLAKVDANDLTGAQTHFAPEFVFAIPFGDITTREALRGLGEGFNAAFPGMQHRNESVWDQDDVVIVEGRWVGTNTGPLTLPDGTTVPPTGRTVEFPYVVVARLEAGLMTRMQAYFDNASFMAQLGLLEPSPA